MVCCILCELRCSPASHCTFVFDDIIMMNVIGLFFIVDPVEIRLRWGFLKSFRIFVR